MEKQQMYRMSFQQRLHLLSPENLHLLYLRCYEGSSMLVKYLISHPYILLENIEKKFTEWYNFQLNSLNMPEVLYKKNQLIPRSAGEGTD